MTKWHSFEGRIVPMVWGDSVYTVLPIPQEIADALAAQGTRRVEGELNDHPVNLALTKSPAIDSVFVYTGKSLLREAGIEPEQIIDVRLRATDPNLVETPEDVALALRSAGKTERWAALTPGKQRGHLHQIASAKRAETRLNRIEKLVQDLD